MELAIAIDKKNESVLDDLPLKRRRRIASLLDKLGHSLRGEDITYSPLYAKRINSTIIREEAKNVAPDDSELAHMERTQRRALRNLAVYLTDSHMDAYVATSMREDADFISVNSFAQKLFDSPQLKKLHLRYFNPTQSWINDRVAKGIVEALMLRRAQFAVYMAQKSDTFGKDSEASVALGQGKPVIVYVPRLFDELVGIDSDELYQMSETDLAAYSTAKGGDPDEGVDKRELFKLALKRSLLQCKKPDINRIVFQHWADFDLHGEVIRISESSLREACIRYIDNIRLSPETEIDSIEIESAVQAKIVDIFVDVAAHFETRATTFRDIHPLALQVIVRSGVLNGILVVRSVDECAEVIYRLLSNTIESFVDEDGNNYMLIENITKSVLRVVSKNQLLTNAFWTHYFDN